MSITDRPLQRRDFLRGTLGLAALATTGSLTACATSGTGTTPPGATSSAPGPVSNTNPFGMAANSTVDAVIFKGGYGVDYAEFAGKQVEALQSGSTVKVTPATNIAQTLQPRFVAGNPPDVIDNSGANLIGINTIRDQLEDLTDVLEAQNYEGVVIKDTLYAGVTEPGTFDGKFVNLNYALTVYALWYSASLFEKEGWTVPKTYEEMLDLGAKAKAKGKYLLGWGKEAATYYRTMTVASAIKQGGDEVRLALDNLKPGCWSLPPVQDVFTGLKKIIDAGYVKPGGAGTQFTAAQAQWSEAEDFILYPSGGWIENEMKTQTKDGFKMTGAPEPVVSSDSKMPWEALHST
ncbi:MAG TPA: N-acetylglucosamine/diacetylchitobiose ABC transporter substrate-binding protein, partial [Propionibacteriaceae bacterium]|nr:N-acetylglucosamine/diacetylchitobiose ABC transporter substrate-binding protein [Propionibacteriaceae bacterium]